MENVLGAHSKKEAQMKEIALDALFFNKMLTPKIITAVYWLLLVVCVVGGLYSMLDEGFRNVTFGKFLVGTFGIVVGAVAARIWCELMIVLFKMNEALQELRHK